MTIDERTAALSDENGLKPCPFCGSTDIDPEGVACFKREYRGTDATWDTAKPEQIENRPSCQNCNATTDGDWNTRAEALSIIGGLTKPVSLSVIVNNSEFRNQITDAYTPAREWHEDVAKAVLEAIGREYVD